VRIVNTQDVVRAALLPGLAVLASALLIAAWRGRGRVSARAAPLARAAAIEAAVVALAIALLLGAVAIGRLYAVEAAATGALALVAWAALSRQLDRHALRAVLGEAMTLTGLLLALLVGATTFSLVLRVFGTDALVAAGMQALGARPALLLGAVLAGFVLCSFVLDAFEMIFLVIPLVMPPLLVAIPDAAWVAALTLLVLQAGFLLPPLGYAIVMSRRALAAPPALSDLARALAPHLVAQLVVIAALVAWPALVHWGDEPAGTTPAASEQEIERLMNDASRAQPGR
jgi:TRAP-type mannitol/chloroaromatic compound transport system permease large subunit